MANKTLFWSFYVSFCTFYASLRPKRTLFTRPKTSIISVNPVILSDIIRVLRALRGEKIPEISVNSWLINDLRSTKAYVRKNNLFMQNKANFKKVKFNVTKVLTKDYDQMDTWSIRKTKPIQSQSKPIQSQLKPIQSQLKPKQTQFQSPICPGYLLINRMNRICCVCGLTVLFDSAKMALYTGNWNLEKDDKKKLNLLKCKRLNNPGLRWPLTGTLFAHSYLANFVLTN